jgi:type II secretion system (T2SS) protein G
MIAKLCGILCGVALTWMCAATGLAIFGELRGHHDVLAQSKVGQARWRVVATEQALAMYALEHHRCPGRADDLIAGDYIRARNLIDPWGTPIAYSCSEDDLKAVSAGPDRIFGTADDVTTAR